MLTSINTLHHLPKKLYHQLVLNVCWEILYKFYSKFNKSSQQRKNLEKLVMKLLL